MDEIRWEFYPHAAAQEHAREWLLFLSKTQKAPKTIDAYARCLDDLIEFFEQANLPLIEASRGDVAAYLNDLHHRANPKGRGNARTHAGGLSHATIQQRLTAARLWYEHLTYCKIRQDQVNPVGRGTYARSAGLYGKRERGLLPRQRQQPWIPGDDEWDAFLEIVLREEPLRNQAMIFLAYEGALRRSELIALKVSDIDWPHQTITVRPEITKNGQGKLIFYGDTTQALLTAYMRHRQQVLATSGGSSAGWLFVSESHRNPGQPLSKDMWNKIVHRLGERAGLPQFKTHTFRHLRLTDFARCKLEIYEIALLAGHASIESTQLYINLSGGELRERVNTATQTIAEALKRKVQKVQQDHGRIHLSSQ
jgi:site-specific recombinase XerD